MSVFDDHRNAWARFASVALGYFVALPLDPGDVSDVERAIEDEDAEALEEVRRRIRREHAASAASWADAMTDEWRKRFGAGT